MAGTGKAGIRYFQGENALFCKGNNIFGLDTQAIDWCAVLSSIDILFAETTITKIKVASFLQYQ